MEAVILEKLREQATQAAQIRAAAAAEMETADAQLMRAAQSVVDGAIERDVYARLSTRYRAARDAARVRLASVPADVGGAEEQAESVLSALSAVGSMADLYSSKSPSARRELMSSITPSGFAVESGTLIKLSLTPFAALIMRPHASESHKRKDSAPREGSGVSCGDPDET